MRNAFDGETRACRGSRVTRESSDTGELVRDKIRRVVTQKEVNGKG